MYLKNYIIIVTMKDLLHMYDINSNIFPTILKYIDINITINQNNIIEMLCYLMNIINFKMIV